MIAKMQIAILAAALSSIASMVRAEAPSDISYSHAQLETMIRGAHTVQQYQTLASYYRGQQQAYEQKAQAEKLEWQRRSRNVMGPLAKYPRPVDSSRNRYEYFAYEAQQMSRHAAHYENLSAGAPQ